MRRHLVALPLALTCGLPLAAQATFDLDRTSPGALGGTLSLQVRNAGANRLFLVMMGFSKGPTPIAQFDPQDPRSVDVGLELASNWYVRGTDGAGQATIDTALPNDPAFHGYSLYWQAGTFPGSPTLVLGLSNPVTTVLGTTATSTALPNPLLQARAGATVIPTPQRNLGGGDFLLVSGGTSEFFQSRGLDSVAGPAMQTPRALHATARLLDGRVLFTGGLDGTGVVTTACEVYDPVANTFTAVANLSGPRAGHAAATLPDGRVLVVGGTTNFTDLTTAAAGALNTTALWNPATDTWTAGPNLGGRRLVPALTTLANGRVLVSGGIEVTLLLNIPIAVTSTNKAQLFNPATNTWSNAANMPNGRAYHHDSQLQLADGRVLLSGGILVPDLLNAANSASIAAADLYNPTTNTWTSTTMATARTAHTATQLPDGRVVVTGGSTGLLSAPTATDSVELFVPTGTTWTAGAPLTTARAGHSAVRTPDGLLLLVGGTSAEAIRF